jgi:hypothetical protein
MRHASIVRFLAVGVLFSVVLVSGVPAFGQATRTWVSGVGDDANPCSRTAPCKTFAGAISKTATGGEINVLDPGGFGAVTITKSITISSESPEAGVLVSGTNGIVVNAAAGAVIVLRGLDFEGLGTGINGIRFLAGGALHVEDCTINNFTNMGISFEPSGPSKLFVKDTITRNSKALTTSSGILVSPPVGGSALVSLDNVRMENNSNGLRVEGDSEVVVRHSVVTSSLRTGVLATGTTGGMPRVNLESSVVSNNGINGVRAFGNGTTIRISSMVVTGNVSTGLSTGSAGIIVSFGNNSIAGNGVDGSPTTTIPLI